MLEYCHNGSLESFIRENKAKFTTPGNEAPFTTTSLYKWASEIAIGLDYIHGRKIIHADLAIRNVLVTNNYVMKIGDFGLSRQLVDTASYTKTTHVCFIFSQNILLKLGSMKTQYIKSVAYSVLCLGGTWQSSHSGA